MKLLEAYTTVLLQMQFQSEAVPFTNVTINNLTLLMMNHIILQRPIIFEIHQVYII